MPEKINLNKIHRAIGRLEGKVEIGFKSMNGRLDKLNDGFSKHDDRINIIETEQDIMKGAKNEANKRAGALGGASGVIGASLIILIDYIISKLTGK